MLLSEKEGIRETAEIQVRAVDLLIVVNFLVLIIAPKSCRMSRSGQANEGDTGTLCTIL
jgi:hypothetical protein